MVRLVLNQQEQIVDNLPESWGELLRRLEAEAAVRGELVSAVRFNGADEPTFQQPAQARRAVRGFATIEVETAAPGALVDAALAHGAAAAAVLAVASRQTSEAFRRSDGAAANARLAELGEGIGSLVTVLEMVASLGISLDRAEWNGRTVPAQLGEIVGQLQSMIDAQQAEDWLTVADILEYGIHPALDTAQPVFEGVRAAIRG